MGSLAFLFVRWGVAIISLLIIIAAIIDSMRLKLYPIPKPAIMFLLGVGLLVLSGLRKKDERKVSN